MAEQGMRFRNDQDGIAWWNSCTEEERAHWLRVAASAVPLDAWLAYLAHHNNTCGGAAR